MPRLPIAYALAVLVLGAGLLPFAPAARAADLEISESELYDRIYASWLGQLAGNIYGLPHENIHIDAPGADEFPYGYDALEIPYYRSHFGATRMTGVMKAYGGAFSDDDTDIEYIYLDLMEREGIEPSYAALRDAWVAHIDNWVWIANRQALALMHHGYGPPFTGAKRFNTEWFQIDPQLINEIWAITAPGMTEYAAGKSLWGAKVSADAESTGPTVAYGAMFAAAFFEPDVEKLIDIGAAALPEGAPFRDTIARMKTLHAQYPDDWQAARRDMAQTDYVEADPKSIWTANLNGACAILALLYGGGDFQRTLDLASAMGFDADNQAATLGGLLGVAHGTKAIPDAFLYPVDGWTQPFNDRYLNRSRRALPSTTITGLARRTMALAEDVILAHGGSVREVDGEKVFRIPSGAAFTPPLELAPLPPVTLTLGEPFHLALYGGGTSPAFAVSDGALPPGLSLSADGILSGTPTGRGRFAVTLTARADGKAASGAYVFDVEGTNLAPSAAEVFGPALQDGATLEALRNGKAGADASVSSVPADTQLETFGYRWAEPVRADAITVTMGRMDEDAGWFNSLTADYLTPAGSWAALPGLTIEPEPVLDNDKHLHPHAIAYTIRFAPVETTGLRISGLNGGGPYAAEGRHVALSELAVHAAP